MQQHHKDRPGTSCGRPRHYVIKCDRPWGRGRAGRGATAASPAVTFTKFPVTYFPSSIVRSSIYNVYTPLVPFTLLFTLLLLFLKSVCSSRRRATVIYFLPPGLPATVCCCPSFYFYFSASYYRVGFFLYYYVLACSWCFIYFCLEACARRCFFH